MNIEQLQQAYDLGATHCLELPTQTKIYLQHGGRMCEILEGGKLVATAWLAGELPIIDYSPLNDYQQDKALDIAVTGIAE